MSSLKCLVALLVIYAGSYGETICKKTPDNGGMLFIYSDENGSEVARARVEFPKLAQSGVENIDSGAVENMFATPNFGMHPKLISGSIPDGEVKTYTPEGGITQSENYLNGKLEGKSYTYGPNGKVLLESNYVAGLMDGKYYMYKPDGTTMIEMTFDRGIIQGVTVQMPGQDKPITMSAEQIKASMKHLPEAMKSIKEKQNLKGRKVALVTKASDYKEDNYLKSSFILKGAEVTVFSDSADEGKGILSIKGVELSDYDIVLFEGVDKSITENKELFVKIKQLVSDGKILAAGNGAEIVLAKAGVLKDKKVSKPASAEVEKILISAGALIGKKGVVVSGKLVTFSGSDTGSIINLSAEIGRLAKAE